MTTATLQCEVGGGYTDMATTDTLLRGVVGGYTDMVTTATLLCGVAGVTLTWQLQLLSCVD